MSKIAKGYTREKDSFLFQNDKVQFSKGRKYDSFLSIAFQENNSMDVLRVF